MVRGQCGDSGCFLGKSTDSKNAWRLGLVKKNFLVVSIVQRWLLIVGVRPGGLGIPIWFPKIVKGLDSLGVPRFESQNTGPETNN